MMRKVIWSLAVLALWGMANNLRAEGPLAQWNRFFGLGWGNGYHVGWNDCVGGNGGATACAVSQAANGQVPANQERTPANESSPSDYNGVQPPHDKGIIHDKQGVNFGTDRSKIVLFAPPQRPSSPMPTAKPSAARVVRLPPVVENSHVSVRLPPVTTR